MIDGILVRKSYLDEFELSDKTLFRDIMAAKEILQDFYGYSIAKRNPQVYERIDL